VPLTGGWNGFRGLIIVFETFVDEARAWVVTPV
jgi:hypothetical protein